MIALSDILPKIRRELDEPDFLKESVLDISTAASRFSDEDLKNRVLDAARYISMRVRPNVLVESIFKFNPSDLYQLYPTTNSDDNWPTTKLLDDRVYYNQRRARRRTFVGHLTGALPSKEGRPIYVYEDGEFFLEAGETEFSSDIYGPTAADSAVWTFGILCPMFDQQVNTWSGVLVSTDAVYDGIDWTGETFVPVSDSFEKAIIHYVAASTYFTLGNIQQSSDFRGLMQRDLSPYLLKRFKAS